MHKLSVTIELGRKADVDVELTFDCQPAEERVLYDRDGSGYPGCEAQVEITGVKVTTYSNGDTQVLRYDRPDWFKWLDNIVLRVVNSDADRYVEMLCDDLGDGD